MSVTKWSRVVRPFLLTLLTLLALPLVFAPSTVSGAIKEASITRSVSSISSATETPTADPDLEPGFPAQAIEYGWIQGFGPAISTLVGNIDSDPNLEIMATSLSGSPLYAWKSNGTVAPGWPAPTHPGTGYPALGKLSSQLPGLQVFDGHRATPGTLIALSGSASTMPGWPRSAANYVTSPASLADVNGDGLDEIFIGEED